VNGEYNTVPGQYTLSQNYPNPFNPSTVIGFNIPVASYVSLKVYDILGREVAELIDEHKPAGIYKVDFHAANLPSGVYLYIIKSGDFVQSKKMLMIK
jgi:hypothetical protein